ncbi:hypothetical protein BIW11_09331 [Tropilaelaps mercedesae]|uniref:Uncharacterized protein n=1 Tax=Tropilaelaps mercedesae TaxID=418985 RepID=A0A1V9XKM2_9ACAR|nr:hypothetical protein BIW11_09331 [Tropilaelaps mercedesae]
MFARNLNGLMRFLMLSLLATPGKVGGDYDPGDTSGFREDLLNRYLSRTKELLNIGIEWDEIEATLETEDAERTLGEATQFLGIDLPWRRKAIRGSRHNKDPNFNDCGHFAPDQPIPTLDPAISTNLHPQKKFGSHAKLAFYLLLATVSPAMYLYKLSSCGSCQTVLINRNRDRHGREAPFWTEAKLKTPP